VKLIKVISLILIAFVSNDLSGQKAVAGSRIGIKVYSSIQYFKSIERYSTPIDGRNTIDSATIFQIKPFNLALNITTEKGIIHELEFADLTWRSDQTNVIRERIDSARYATYKATEKDFRLALRYQIFWPIFSSSKKGRKKKQSKNTDFLIGTGLQTLYSKKQTIPEDPNRTSPFVPVKTTGIGAGLFITPRILSNFGERLYLDINIPVNIFRVERYSTPLPYDLPTYKHRVNDFLPRSFELNVGVGVRL